MLVMNVVVLQLEVDRGSYCVQSCCEGSHKMKLWIFFKGTTMNLESIVTLSLPFPKVTINMMCPQQWVTVSLKAYRSDSL